MIAVDTNILVYAHRREAPLHASALAAIASLADHPAAWGIPWPCLHEFYSTVTSNKVRPPTSMAIAWEAIHRLADLPNLRMLGEGADHIDRLHRIANAGRIVGGAIHDARIAAICLAHGVTELWTADRDFSRFPQLKTRNPLSMSP